VKEREEGEEGGKRRRQEMCGGGPQGSGWNDQLLGLESGHSTDDGKKRGR
jgi:hypothetical protein